MPIFFYVSLNIVRSLSLCLTSALALSLYLSSILSLSIFQKNSLHLLRALFYYPISSIVPDFTGSCQKLVRQQENSESCSWEYMKWTSDPKDVQLVIVFISYLFFHFIPHLLFSLSSLFSSQRSPTSLLIMLVSQLPLLLKPLPFLHS